MNQQKHIVVLTQGFVLVGNYTRGTDLHVITEASIIRVWGTTAGLGELALRGPQKETLLDPCGTVEVPPHAEVFSIVCVKEKWPQ